MVAVGVDLTAGVVAIACVLGTPKILPTAFTALLTSPATDGVIWVVL